MDLVIVWLWRVLDVYKVPFAKISSCTFWLIPCLWAVSFTKYELTLIKGKFEYSSSRVTSRKKRPWKNWTSHKNAPEIMIKEVWVLSFSKLTIWVKPFHWCHELMKDHFMKHRDFFQLLIWPRYSIIVPQIRFLGLRKTVITSVSYTHLTLPTIYSV